MLSTRPRAGTWTPALAGANPYTYRVAEQTVWGLSVLAAAPNHAADAGPRSHQTHGVAQDVWVADKRTALSSVLFGPDPSWLATPVRRWVRRAGVSRVCWEAFVACRVTRFLGHSGTVGYLSVVVVVADILDSRVGDGLLPRRPDHPSRSGWCSRDQERRGSPSGASSAAMRLVDATALSSRMRARSHATESAGRIQLHSG